MEPHEFCKNLRIEVNSKKLSSDRLCGCNHKEHNCVSCNQLNGAQSKSCLSQYCWDGEGCNYDDRSFC